MHLLKPCMPCSHERCTRVFPDPRLCNLYVMHVHEPSNTQKASPMGILKSHLRHQRHYLPAERPNPIQTLSSLLRRTLLRNVSVPYDRTFASRQTTLPCWKASRSSYALLFCFPSSNAAFVARKSSLSACTSSTLSISPSSLEDEPLSDSSAAL